jgi:tetratricopeptide (TPR) repeat protein/O-antigen ligase
MKIFVEDHGLSKPTLDGAIEFVWLLLIFAIPLYFNPFAMNSFYFVKSLILVLLVCLMLGLLAAQLILRAQSSRSGSIVQVIKNSPLQTAAIVFGCILIISTVFSIMPYKSLWGNLAGTVGLLTNISWILFFIIVALKMRRRSQLFRALYVLLISSGLVSLLGILQFIDPHILPWFHFQGRAFSTDGNPLSLSAFIAMILPITLAMVILAWYGSPSQPRNKIIFAGLLALFALQLTCLAMAQYSVTLLLFIVGIFSFFALIGIYLQKKATVALSIVFLLVIAIIAGVLLGPMLVTPANEIDTGNQGSAVSTAEQVGLPTLSIRVDAWRSAASIIVQSPEIAYFQDPYHWLRRAIGYGPETLIAVCQSKFPASLKSQYTFNSLVIAQPENHYLYLGVTIGIIGLLAFLAVLAVFALIAFRSLRMSKDRETILMLSAFIAAIAQYCVHIFFNASVIDPELVLWTVLGLTVALISIQSSEAAAAAASSGVLQDTVIHVSPGHPGIPQVILSVLTVIAFLAVGLYLTIPPLVANMKMQSGLTLFDKDKYAALSLYQDAARIDPHQSYYFNFVGNLASIMATETGDDAERQRLLRTSEAAYLNAIQQEPQMAIWYYRLADIDVYWAANGNGNKYSDALSLYEKADRLFPGNAVILDKWAFALILKGDYAGALAKVKEAELNDPSWIQSAYFEGLAQASMGDNSRAAQLLLSPAANEFDAVRYFINFCSLSAGYGKAPLIRDALKMQLDSLKGDWIGFTFLGISDVYTGYFEEAIQAFKQSALLVQDSNKLLLAGIVKTMFSNNSQFQPAAQEIVNTLLRTNARSQ